MPPRRRKGNPGPFVSCRRNEGFRHSRFMKHIALLVVLASASASAWAQELRLSACDAVPGGTPAGGGATVSVNTADKKEGTGSFQLTLAQTPANGPYLRLDATASWAGYSAIRFWVKRVSGTM